MLATCVLFYVISGILFWSTDYFVSVIKVPKDEVTVAFGLTSITAPVFGAIVSIPLENKIGFNSKATLPCCLVIAAVCYAAAFFIPFYSTRDEFYAIIAHIWFLLFFGGMLLPITNGRILSIVPKEYSAHGQSLCYACFNLFGWLPSPFIYGAICNAYGGKDADTSKAGMWALTQSILVALILLCLAQFGSILKNCCTNQNDYA